MVGSRVEIGQGTEVFTSRAFHYSLDDNLRDRIIAEEGDETVRPYAAHLLEVPAVPTLMQPLVSTVPLQVLAAEIARQRGYDVDKPRNLAKSVTVE